MKRRIDTLLVIDMKRRAELGIWYGQGFDIYFQSCRDRDYISGTQLIFTRDAGHHSGGWWKNPDYERCYHLSLSFYHPLTGDPRPKDEKLTLMWLKAFFGDSVKYLWCEPPRYMGGRKRDTWHYRLFCDEGWQPIKPRGEVYSKEYTERGWKSFSELKGKP